LVLVPVLKQSKMGRGAQPSAPLLLFSLGLVLLYFTAGKFKFISTSRRFSTWSLFTRA